MKLFNFNPITGKRGSEIQTPFSDAVFCGWSRDQNKPEVGNYIPVESVECNITISSGKKGFYTFTHKDLSSDKLNVDSFCFCTGKNKKTGKWEWCYISK